MFVLILSKRTHIISSICICHPPAKRIHSEHVHLLSTSWVSSIQIHVHSSQRPPRQAPGEPWGDMTGSQVAVAPALTELLVKCGDMSGHSTP